MHLRIIQAGFQPAASGFAGKESKQKAPSSLPAAKRQQPRTLCRNLRKTDSRGEKRAASAYESHYTTANRVCQRLVSGAETTFSFVFLRA
jgi:hypothetical protein